MIRRKNDGINVIYLSFFEGSRVHQLTARIFSMNLMNPFHF